MTFFTRRMRDKAPFLPALVILMIVIAFNGFAEPNSLSLFAVKGFVATYLVLMFLAVAQTIVVFAGDIDLSIGAIVGLVNVTVVTLLNHFGGGTIGIALALLSGLGVGVLCGLINGFLVVSLRLQAIVATFASSIVFTGLALYVMPVAGTPVPSVYWRTYSGNIAGIPFVFWVSAGLLLFAALLIRSKLLLQILTVGDDRKAAYQSGLPVNSLRVRGYMLCGLFSALAALCITGDTASGDPNVGGAIVLNSVAAAVLGGTALSGGSGSLLGSILGALVIGFIGSLVYFLGTPSQWQNLVQGLTILVALMVGILVSRKMKA